MALHNPNNWHWVNKDVSPWAKEYLTTDLVGVKAEQGGVSAEISKLLDMSGDVDVSQRKGKVITLFDLRLQLEYTGKVPIEEEVEDDAGIKSKKQAHKDISGTITIPEVAHDTEEDEYVFEIAVYSESSEAQPVKDLVRKEILPQLRTRLQKLAPALIAEHGKDIQHAPGYKANFTPAKVLSHSRVTKADETSTSTSTTTAGGVDGPKVNVTSLSDRQEFRTTAEQLYETFTDPQRIAAFTRAPPRLFEGARPGGKFEIFGGNVSGEYTVLDRPTAIGQRWRLAQWPAGHYSTLSIKFEQNDVDAVTIMAVDWEGVPVGEEDATRRNWADYYVRSIKTTFGFGTIL